MVSLNNGCKITSKNRISKHFIEKNRESLSFCHLIDINQWKSDRKAYNYFARRLKGVVSDAKREREPQN